MGRLACGACVLIISVALGAIVASLPIIAAFFPAMFGIDTTDPTAGAALPFLLFCSIPAGLITSFTLFVAYLLLDFLLDLRRE